jgi:hypothetical protein
MRESIPDRAVTASDLVPAQRRFLRLYRSWRRFHYGPRQGSQPLSAALHSYPNAVLVGGCQRSGTTMLTRVIARAKGFRPLHLTHDDELDAALALCGYIELPRNTRYCFQTVYLNERYGEYRDLRADQRLIWVLRNPASVVYSMVYNWRRFALNELYESVRAAASARQPAIDPAGAWGLLPRSRAQKAIVSYVGKSAQILQIADWMRADRLLIVDYDELVRAPLQSLPRIFEFIGEPYNPAYAGMIRSDSAAKAARLPARLRRRIEALAMPTYLECRQLLSSMTPATQARRAMS